MLTEFVLITGVGMAMAVTSISQSMVAGQKSSISAFYSLATLLAAPLAWFFSVNWSGWDATAPRLWDLVLLLFAANLINCAGQACIVKAMGLGHRAATLAIAQSAMSLTFLERFVIGGEEPGPAGMLGLIAILSGITLLSTSGQKANTPFHLRWFLLALLAFLFIGGGQILSTWPSRWIDWSDVARVRTPISLSLSAGIYTAAMLLLGERHRRPLLRPALLWAAAAVMMFTLLFSLLDRMTAAGSAGIVFPATIGVCLVAFSLYSRFRLKEPFRWRAVAGLLLVLTGIAGLMARGMPCGRW